MSARRFNRHLLALTTAAGGCFSAATAAAHIDLTEPSPRVTQDQKTNPCGGTERGEPTEVEAGSTITVKWVDTIPHPGWYTISFDPTGDDFDGDGDGTGDFQAQSVDTAGEFSNGDGSLILMTDIDVVEFDGNRPGGEHEVQVTLPSEPCDDCTLQLIQVMDDTGHAPNEQRPAAHIYFRCADLRLVAPSQPPMGSGGTGNMPSEPDAGPMGSDDTEPGPTGDTGATEPEGMSGMTGMTGAEDPVTPEPIVPPAMTMPPAASSTPVVMMPPAMTMPPATSPTPMPTPATSATMPTTAPSMSAGPMDAGDDGGDEGSCAFKANANAPASGALAVLGAALLVRLRRRARG